MRLSYISILNVSLSSVFIWAVIPLLHSNFRNWSKQANCADRWRSRRWRICSGCSCCIGCFICQVPHCTTVHKQKQGWRPVHNPRWTAKQKKCLRSAWRHGRTRRLLLNKSYSSESSCSKDRERYQTDKITIQWKSMYKPYCAIHRLGIYPIRKRYPPFEQPKPTLLTCLHIKQQLHM